jgi:hypothetical protein
MKALSAVILLLIQGRPLWGLVLCMGLGAADEGRMEAGCQMGDHASASIHVVHDTSQPSLADAAPQPSQADRHGCMLADICTLVTPAVALRPSQLFTPNTPYSSAVWDGGTIHGQEHQAPPTPPPNA